MGTPLSIVRVAALLLLAAVFAAQAVGAGGLLTRASHEGGFTIKLPAGWHYKDATYPSDHSTEFWTAPGDANSRLEVNVSGCVGCVERGSCTLRNTGCGPYPAADLPRGTTSKRALGKWAEKFVARVPGNPYLDRGLVVIRHQGSAIRDWAYVQLWLPASQRQLADSILASFAFGW
ncbi:MAG TPA: hypothetical protein VMV08_09475 [Gaiellaceae bacterium]|nr:hypothetical protein [Gaiellaceae bacterium]